MPLPPWLPPRRLGFAAILLLGAFLRLRGLGAESLWHDESWTWDLVRDGPGRLLDHLRHRDAHPPLYYLIVQLFTRFDVSEAALRLPSALFGIAALPFLYRLGATLGGPAVGLVSMLLLALSPFHIYFSQEARSYTLLFFLAAVSLDLLFDLRRAPGRAKWILFALATTAIMLTHYMGAFFLLSEIAIVALFRRDRPGFAREFALAAAGAFLLYLPWLPTFLAHGRSLSGGFWIPKPTWEIFGVSLYHLVSHVYHPGYRRAALAVLPFYVLLLAVPLFVRRRETLALSLLFAVPIAGELLFSLHRPIYYTRTFIYVLSPLFLTAALGAFRLPARLRAAACAILCGGLVPSTLNLHRTLEKEDWRSAAQLLSRGSAPGERIVVDEGFVAVNLEVYAALSPGPRDWLDRVRRVDHGTLEHPAIPRAAVEADLAGAPGVWVVFRYGNDHGWFDRLSRDFERRGSWKRFGVEVHHFRRRSE